VERYCATGSGAIETVKIIVKSGAIHRGSPAFHRHFFENILKELSRRCVLIVGNLNSVLRISPKDIITKIVITMPATAITNPQKGILANLACRKTVTVNKLPAVPDRLPADLAVTEFAKSCYSAGPRQKIQL